MIGGINHIFEYYSLAKGPAKILINDAYVLSALNKDHTNWYLECIQHCFPNLHFITITIMFNLQVQVIKICHYIIVSMGLLESDVEGIDDLFIASQYTPLSVYQQIPVQWRANPETWETTISGDDFISPFHLYLYKVMMKVLKYCHWCYLVPY